MYGIMLNIILLNIYIYILNFHNRAQWDLEFSMALSYVCIQLMEPIHSSIFFFSYFSFCQWQVYPLYSHFYSSYFSVFQCLKCMELAIVYNISRILHIILFLQFCVDCTMYSKNVDMLSTNPFVMLTKKVAICTLHILNIISLVNYHQWSQK